MATAYSLQKMRKALNDLRNSVAAQKEAQRAQSNLTSNGNSNGNGGGRTDEKRSHINNGERKHLRKEIIKESNERLYILYRTLQI